LATHPDFSREAGDFRASPAVTASDGFYVAKLNRA
jgi:hypothetical protein